MEKLAIWARRDAELIAPHYGLDFPANAPTSPDQMARPMWAFSCTGFRLAQFISPIKDASNQMWAGQAETSTAESDLHDALEAGSARLAELGHYSGGTFYYGGEWYWGVDRLFYLEQRLRDLGLCHQPELPFICPRPEIDVSGVDASNLTLDFYPSLNSPYTSIIYDHTIKMKNECGIQFSP